MTGSPGGDEDASAAPTQQGGFDASAEGIARVIELASRRRGMPSHSGRQVVLRRREVVLPMKKPARSIS